MKVPAKEKRYRQRRREIIDAAAHIFAEKGYPDASTRDIARILGIQQGSVYHYVSSKEDALEEACKAGIEGFVDGARRILLSPDNVSEKIEAAVANHLFPVENRLDYVIVFLRERHHLPESKRQRILELSGEYENILESILSQGLETGVMDRSINPRLATLALIGLCNSALPWLNKSNDYSVSQVVQTFSSILQYGLISA